MAPVIARFGFFFVGSATLIESLVLVSILISLGKELLRGSWKTLSVLAYSACTVLLWLAADYIGAILIPLMCVVDLTVRPDQRKFGILSFLVLFLAAKTLVFGFAEWQTILTVEVLTPTDELVRRQSVYAPSIAVWMASGLLFFHYLYVGDDGSEDRDLIIDHVGRLVFVANLFFRGPLYGVIALILSAILMLILHRTLPGGTVGLLMDLGIPESWWYRR